MKHSSAQKMANVIDYLKLGLEVQMEGRTYVWLDNHPTQVINGVQYGIDGLAIKGITISSNNHQEPHYLGQSDISVMHFMKMVDTLPESVLDKITVQLAAASFLNQHSRGEKKQ